jgi:hypothetical protein
MLSCFGHSWCQKLLLAPNHQMPLISIRFAAVADCHAVVHPGLLSRYDDSSRQHDPAEDDVRADRPLGVGLWTFASVAASSAAVDSGEADSSMHLARALRVTTSL